jgi:transposase-like protein
MTRTSLQLIDGGRLSAEPSPAVRLEAYNLYRAGRAVGQVARFMDLDYNTTSDAIFEHQNWREAQAEMRGFRAGRRSLLNAPPSVQQRRAA